ncbi:MAG: HTH domain-containing protein [Clostridia bacterium]
MTKRRDIIKKELKGSDEPITANYFANRLSVSRQIIVGDVALLGASGLDILATPRGYIMNDPKMIPPFLSRGSSPADIRLKRCEMSFTRSSTSEQQS